MSNFIEIFNWIVGLGFPETFDQYERLKNSKDSLLTDISIVIMNSHKNPNIEVQFKDCFPTGISDVNLDTTQTDVVYPQATVSFSFVNYTIRKID
jgi:hypothetical protein